MRPIPSLKSAGPKALWGDPGILVVTTEPAFPPFVLSHSGQPVKIGFDVDLMNEIATRLDLGVDYAYIPFDGLFATRLRAPWRRKLPMPRLTP